MRRSSPRRASLPWAASRAHGARVESPLPRARGRREAGAPLWRPRRYASEERAAEARSPEPGAERSGAEERKSGQNWERLERRVGKEFRRCGGAPRRCSAAQVRAQGGAVGARGRSQGSRRSAGASDRFRCALPCSAVLSLLFVYLRPVCPACDKAKLRFSRVSGSSAQPRRAWARPGPARPSEPLSYRWIEFPGDFICPGFFDDEAKRHKRCKAWHPPSGFRDGSQWLRVRVLKPRLHGAQTASAHVSSYTSYLRISFPSSHPYRCARAGRRWGREAGSLTRKGPSSSRPVPGVSCQRSGFRTQWKRWIKGSASKSWPNSSRSMINASGSSFHKSRTPVCKIELREECMPLRAASHFNFPNIVA